ncbi:MAG TPA: nucleoside triphosphate pyrophosphohydrolase [Armatimonadetes bacterium]|nr:nucleoside triphosphate pyrophosphohydrolase [Armatimonadota bacterium]
MAVLRSERGCPWDREQTPTSLKRYLLEECYEVLEALDGGDAARLCEELGDLLLQIVFQAQLAKEAGQFDINQVCAGLVAKLYRRHPHVFGEVKVADAEEVLRRWEQLKRQERPPSKRASVLEGVPKALPALARAYQIQKRAARVGFDWEQVQGPLDKVEEELKELRVACRNRKEGACVEEVGDVLFALVNACRFLRVDPEEALRQAIRKFERRFRRLEERARARGQALENLNLAEMDVLWEQIKAEEEGG